MFNPRYDEKCAMDLKTFTNFKTHLIDSIVKLYNWYQNNNQTQSRELYIEGTNQSNLTNKHKTTEKN